MNTDYVPLHKFIYKFMQRFTAKYLTFVRGIQVFSCCVFASLFNTQKRGKVFESLPATGLCYSQHKVACASFRMCTDGWTVGGMSRDLLGVQIT